MSKSTANDITVLFVAPHITYPGNTGGAAHLTEVVDELTDFVNVTVVCDCGNDFVENGATFYDVDCGRFSLLSFPRIWRLSKDADLVYSRADPFELAGPIAAWLRGIPIIGEINTNFLAYEKKYSIRDWLYPVFHAVKYSWLRFFVRWYDRVTCVSDVIRSELLDLGFDADDVVVVPNGGNPDRFNDITQEAAREELGFSPEDYIVLLMGELGPRHGLHTLLEAGISEATFLVVGGKDRYREYLEQVQEEASDNFIFYDPVPYSEIPRFIVASDVVAAPYEESDNSHPFGFCPIKVLDGMAAGRPVIASDRPWIREILSADEGVITDNIAEGVLALRNETERKRKGKQARKRVEESLSWRHTAEKLVAVFQDVV